MTEADAIPGDVVQDSAGRFWKCTGITGGGKIRQWATFSGPVLYFGPWEPSYGPQGELTLAGREP